MVKGLTFPGVPVPAKYDAQLYHTQLCTDDNYRAQQYSGKFKTGDFNIVDFTGLFLTIGTGAGVAYGRNFYIDTPEQLEITDATSTLKYGLAILKIDLSQPIGANVKTTYKSSTSGYPTGLVKEDLTGDSGIYEFECIQFTYDMSGIKSASMVTRKSLFDSSKTDFVKSSGDSMTGTLDMTNHKISSVADGNDPTDAVNKRQLDLVGGDIDRTLLNDIDINYDDSAHVLSETKDIFKDLFEKAQAKIGTNKPFILMFRTDSASQMHLANACMGLVYQKYGEAIVDSYMTFKMEVATSNGYVGSSYGETTKITISNEDYEYSWFFDYDNFDNVIVRDASGSSFYPDSIVELWNGNGTNSAEIILNESFLNFGSVSCQVDLESGSFINQKMPVTTLTASFRDSMPVDNQQDSVQLLNTQFKSDVTGTRLNPGLSDVYVTLLRFGPTGHDIVAAGNTVSRIWGHNRIHPRGTTHTVVMINGLPYRKITLPNGEEKIQELPVDFELPQVQHK